MTFLFAVATPSWAQPAPSPPKETAEDAPVRRPSAERPAFSRPPVLRPSTVRPFPPEHSVARLAVPEQRVRKEVRRLEEVRRPEPVPNFAALRDRLGEVAGRHSGRYGVVILDPDSRRGLSLGGEEVFTAASVGKLPTLIALYRAAARGELDLDEEITILPEDVRSYGTGVLHNFPTGSTMTLRECAYYLINDSDNTAWAMLDRRLGVERIQAEISSGVGVEGTDYDMGLTTPKDVLRMLTKISDPRFTDGALSEEMLATMTDTAFEDRLPAALPSDVRVAHKIGSYEDSFGDAGVVFYKDHNGAERRYFVVVLASGTSEFEARAAMQEMSLAVYETLAAPRQAPSVTL